MVKSIPHLFAPSSFSYYTFVVLVVIGVLVLVGVSLLSWRKEGFSDTPSSDELSKALAIGKEIQSATSDAQIKTLMGKMVNELVSVGAFPDTSQFVRKSELTDSKCLVAKAEDRDQYVAKSSIPDQGPRIDMSQYIKKSAVQPCVDKKCPEPVDLSGYVKKSSLFNQKQTACISPQVKVSAGLCKECPPCPTLECPACPIHEPPKCPPPQPCPTQPTQPVRYEIKYVKQPVLITKTVVVDQNNNILSQKVDNSIDSTNKKDNADNANNAYDFIEGLKKTYALYGMNTSMPTISNTKTNTTLPITMATAPCANEASCLISNTLNSNYSKSGGLSGLNLVK
jgi:hypothetical protein